LRMSGNATADFTDRLMEAAALEQAAAEPVVWPDLDVDSADVVPLFAVDGSGNELVP
jgi:hypothetical protein